MEYWYYEKQKKAKELDERNEQRTHQFLLDRYGEGYQDVEVSGVGPVFTMDRGEPWGHGPYKIVTCFHPKKQIQSFGIPIDLYGFMCLSVGEAKGIKFKTLKVYESHKTGWQIKMLPKENLEAYLLRNNILIGTDFVI